MGGSFLPGGSAVGRLQSKVDWLEKVEKELDGLYLFVKPDGDTSEGHAIDRIVVIAAKWRKAEELRGVVERFLERCYIGHECSNESSFSSAWDGNVCTICEMWKLRGSKNLKKEV